MVSSALALAITTFRESLRSKLLYGVVVFAFILVAVSASLGKVTIGDQIKVVKDFGLFCISLAGVATAVISGSMLLQKELQRRTIITILGKAVSRGSFVVGKYLGLLATTWVLTSLMTGALIALVGLLSGEVDLLLAQAGLFMCIELIVVCSLVMLFSAIVITPLLNGLFAFAVFVAGRCVEYVLYFTPGEGFSLARCLYWALPHLNWLHVNNDIVYGVSRSGAYVMLAAVYAASYAIVALLMAMTCFSRRQFR